MSYQVCPNCEELKNELIAVEVENAKIKTVLSTVAIKVNRENINYEELNTLLDTLYSPQKEVQETWLS